MCAWWTASLPRTFLPTSCSNHIQESFYQQVQWIWLSVVDSSDPLASLQINKCKLTFNDLLHMTHATELKRPSRNTANETKLPHCILMHGWAIVSLSRNLWIPSFHSRYFLIVTDESWWIFCVLSMVFIWTSQKQVCLKIVSTKESAFKVQWSFFHTLMCWETLQAARRSCMEKKLLLRETYLAKGKDEKMCCMVFAWIN